MKFKHDHNDAPPLVILPGGKDITSGDAAGMTYASRFVKDVAWLDGKYRIGDGVVDVDSETHMGTVTTTTKLPNVEPAKVERVMKRDKQGRPLKAELHYTYRGEIRIEQVAVKVERGER